MPLKKDPRERLLIEAAQKDPARFAELYEENFHRVYAFVARRLRHRDDAEDVTAEAFRDALANLGKFEWRGTPFAAWLYRIASNAIADRWQHAARERGQPLTDEPLDDQPVDSNLEEVERKSQLFRLVERLPPDQRRVIEMRFSEDRSIREIAQLLDRTDGAIKQLQLRGLQNLRASLRKPQRRKQTVVRQTTGKRNG